MPNWQSLKCKEKIVHVILINLQITQSELHLRCQLALYQMSSLLDFNHLQIEFMVLLHVGKQRKNKNGSPSSPQFFEVDRVRVGEWQEGERRENPGTKLEEEKWREREKVIKGEMWGEEGKETERFWGGRKGQNSWSSSSTLCTTRR